MNYIISGYEIEPYTHKRINPGSRAISLAEIQERFDSEIIAQIQQEGIFKWQECHGGRILNLQVERVPLTN